jgi:P27 family predicted phage terminase small subunit
MRKKPTELKRLGGTLRADRINLREPKPPKVTDLPPRRGLPLGVRREFALLMEQLAPMHVVTVSDIAMLEIVAAAADEYWRAHRVVTRRGMTYGTKTAAGSTMFRTRPEVGIMADSWRRYSAGLQQFGCSPAARPKVEADAPPPEDELDRFLAQRRTPAAGPDRARFFKS